MIRAEFDTRAVDRVFGELKRRASDYRKPLQEAGEGALKEFEQRFERDGPGWAPNSGANPILEKTGALRRSFTTRGAPGNLYVVNRLDSQFGSSLPYAAIHQTGGVLTLPSGRRMNLPARPVVVIPSQSYQIRLAGIAREHFTVRSI